MTERYRLQEPPPRLVKVDPPEGTVMYDSKLPHLGLDFMVLRITDKEAGLDDHTILFFQPILAHARVGRQPLTALCYTRIEMSALTE